MAASLITAMVSPNNNLLSLKNVVDNIVVDCKYATTDNFTGQKLYKKPLAYLHKDILPDFVAACRDFESLGLGIKIWDAYRPLAVTQKMWDITPNDKKKFVADPNVGSVHNKGCAVDITLYDLATGKELYMPTSFDDFTEKAYPNCQDLPEEAIKNRELLIKLMTKHNFEVDSNEWWHFNWYKYRDCPLLDILI